MTLWLVRSGKYGERENYALENGCAVIGWEDLPNLAAVTSRQDLFNELKSTYSDVKDKTLSNWESQLWPFAHEMKEGDLVVMPLKMRPAIALGKITGPYCYNGNADDVIHSRKVEWLKEVPRNTFAQDLLYSFGSFMTICRISRNDAETRVLSVLNRGVDPACSGSLPLDRARGHVLGEDNTIIASDDTPVAINLAEAAEDSIRQRIATVFKGHKLSALIGALLEAQGYRTFVSPPGPDGGVDVVAKGPFGTGLPALAVQVKSQDTPVDVLVLRQLQGTMTQLSAEQGLLVAWGGVNKALFAEAQRHFFSIHIWDSTEVIRLIQHHYEKLPQEIQAELPLKRIWVLVADE